MSVSRLQIFPPTNEDDFENLCLDLWKEILNDPNAQKNGRRGQRQYGVDIFGRHNTKDALVGIQCKKKDIRLGKKLNEEEVRGEVEKAKSFQPPLSEYIFATTALRDQEIQKVARAITEENRLDGLFSVHIVSWDDILIYLDDYPFLIRK